MLVHHKVCGPEGSIPWFYHRECFVDVQYQIYCHRTLRGGDMLAAIVRKVCLDAFSAEGIARSADLFGPCKS